MRVLLHNGTGECAGVTLRASQESVSAVLLLGLSVRRLHGLEPQKRLKMYTDTLQSATKQALQWGGRQARRISWDTYGGRDAGEDEEAQDRRVQGAVGADDPEHRPLVGVLEDGADLRSSSVFVSKDSAETRHALGRAMPSNALTHAAKRRVGVPPSARTAAMAVIADASRYA